MIVVASNAIVSCLYIIRVEGRFSRQECEYNNTNGPHINFEGVAPLRLKQFRRQIVGSATECFLQLSFMI